LTAGTLAFASSQAPSLRPSRLCIPSENALRGDTDESVGTSPNSLFMLSLARSGHYYQYLLSQGFGIGIGIGMLFIPSISVVAQYFTRMRAIAMGIVLSGSSLGAIVHTIILNKLLDRPSGFSPAIRCESLVKPPSDAALFSLLEPWHTCRLHYFSWPSYLSSHDLAPAQSQTVPP
jgi:MFS family permease